VSTPERIAISRGMVLATLVAGLLAAEAAVATESDIISIRPAQVLDVRNGKLRRGGFHCITKSQAAASA
jgi:hypothetical protein